MNKKVYKVIILIIIIVIGSCYFKWENTRVIEVGKKIKTDTLTK